MNKNNHDDQTVGCLVEAFLVIFFMPIVGLYLMSKEDSGWRTLGTVLFVIGCIFWCWYFIVRITG